MRSVDIGMDLSIFSRIRTLNLSLVCCVLLVSEGMLFGANILCIDVNKGIPSTIRKPLITFDQIFTPSQQKAIGLSKLSAVEKEALHVHVESMLVQVVTAQKQNGSRLRSNRKADKIYAGVSGGHWVKKNIDKGAYILLRGWLALAD